LIRVEGDIYFTFTPVISHERAGEVMFRPAISPAKQKWSAIMSPTNIELLWIIPIVAFVFFFFLLAVLIQRKGEEARVSRGNDRLLKEVDQFNTGEQLGQLTGVREENGAEAQAVQMQAKEIRLLRQKIREMQEEYDQVISENYSLRARMNKLTKNVKGEKQPERREETDSSHRSPNVKKTTPNMLLYDDTRIVKIANLEDTSEIDISDLQ
jgi:regulator of replication initiation timing